MIKAAIFDFDGTLFDSMPIWDNVGEKYLNSIGIEPAPNLWSVLKTMSLKQSVQYLKEEYNICKTDDEIACGINSIVESFYFDTVMPKKGIVKWLDELKKHNVKMCIATATDRYQIEAALKRCNINQYFSEIFTCSEVGYGKDNPFIYRKALEHLETSRLDTIVFEDAMHAIKTAKDDGFITVGIFDLSETHQKEMQKYSDLFLQDYSNWHKFWEFASKI